MLMFGSFLFLPDCIVNMDFVMAIQASEFTTGTHFVLEEGYQQTAIEFDAVSKFLSTQLYEEEHGII